jgi:hypothetical protein
VTELLKVLEKDKVQIAVKSSFSVENPEPIDIGP